MKIIIPIFILLFNFSCNSSNEEALEQENFDDIIVTDSTSFSYPKVELPRDFNILDIKIKDTLTSQHYNVSCLQSELKGMERFNYSIRTTLMEHVLAQKRHLDTSFYSYPMFTEHPAFYLELHPIEIFVNDKVISITHVEDSYLERNNRTHNYWFSFNYDLRMNKVISFEDVFNIQTSKDTIAFNDYIIENHINDCIEDLPYEKMYISFSDEGIYINPIVSGACSLNRAFLNKDDLKFLNPNWKNIYE